MTAANEALSTDTPATVTFDTLSATQELRKTGFEEHQAEAIVSTISKAMSETVATKADLELQSAVTKADIETLGAELKAELKAETGALRAEFKAETGALRAEFKAETGALRAEFKADTEALRTELKLFQQSVDSRFDALENRLILKLGGLMVTMTFLLLAIGPFYIRWVMSLMGSS